LEIPDYPIRLYDDIGLFIGLYRLPSTFLIIYGNRGRRQIARTLC
jgi:hypothetical protein